MKVKEKLNIRENEKKLVDEIIQIVSSYFDVDVTEDTRKRDVSEPRAITAYLIDHFTECTIQEHISTVLNRRRSNLSISISKINDRLDFDRVLKNSVEDLKSIIIKKSFYLKRTNESRILREILKAVYQFDIDELLILNHKIKSESFKLEDNIDA